MERKPIAFLHHQHELRQKIYDLALSILIENKKWTENPWINHIPEKKDHPIVFWFSIPIPNNEQQVLLFHFISLRYII